MSFNFVEAKEIGDVLEEELLSVLTTEERFLSKGWHFKMNPNVTDKVYGDILGYTSNDRLFACIDAKNSNMISLNSIVAFLGFKGGNTQRAYFMTPTSIINNTDYFKNWLLEELYNLFPDLKLQRLPFERLVSYLKDGYNVEQFNDQQLSPLFGVMSRSKEIGINVDQIPLHLKLYYGSKDDEGYRIALYKDLKYKG